MHATLARASLHGSLKPKVYYLLMHKQHYNSRRHCVISSGTHSDTFW